VSPLRVGFRGLLDGGETGVPEAVQESAYVAEAFGPCAIQPPRAVATFFDKAGLTQDPQVFGNVRAADVEPRGNFAGAALAVPHQPQDFLTAGFSESLEQRLHVESVADWLRIQQVTLGKVHYPRHITPFLGRGRAECFGKRGPVRWEQPDLTATYLGNDMFCTEHLAGVHGGYPGLTLVS
jgi:hypothetical protein